MSALAKIVHEFQPVTGATLRIAGADSSVYGVCDPQELSVEAEAGSTAHVVVLHSTPISSTLRITLHEGAQLELTEIFIAEAFSDVTVRQAARSHCRMTLVQLSAANGTYRVDLNGYQAQNIVNGLFLASGEEHCMLHLHTNHNAADCRSVSLVKGVAGACSVGEFCGRVYVAEDAQRTDAQQQSRNILLSDTARILARPQLEIYADDVKCSHGATVGQMDTDAILYMRQRGLSAEQARRVQIEGFAGDVVSRCSHEVLAEALMDAVAAKMENK